MDQHQVILGVGGNSTLADAASLIAPDGFSFPDSFSVARSAHVRLYLVLEILLGSDNPSAHGLSKFGKALTERDMEEYLLRNMQLKYQLTNLFT